MDYMALFEPIENGAVLITFPDFGWGVSQGDTQKQAEEMALALLQTLVAEHIRRGVALPEPRARRGRKYRAVSLPFMQSAKAELYRAFLGSGIRKAEFARRMGISKGNVERLFDLNHHSRMDLIEAAFRVLGKTLSLDVRDAA
jgi:antitoxin HicB